MSSYLFSYIATIVRRYRKGVAIQHYYIELTSLQCILADYMRTGKIMREMANGILI